MQDENSTQELERMEPNRHECHNENKIMVRMISGAFVVVVTIVPACWLIISSTVHASKSESNLQLSALKKEIELQLKAHSNDIKRNEIRNARTEALLLEQGKKMTSAIENFATAANSLKSEIKGLRGDFSSYKEKSDLLYQTKDDAREKFILRKEINNQYLKSVYQK